MTSLGTLGSAERHGAEFPRFSFCFIYSKCGAEEDSNLERITSLPVIWLSLTERSGNV